MDSESQVPQLNTSCSVTVEGRNLILADSGGQLHAFENNCPHANESLDPMGGSVSSEDGVLLRCQRHGAEFLVTNGECVSGPCFGESLIPVAVIAVEGRVYLD